MLVCIACVSGVWPAVQKVSGLSLDPHSHLACRLSQSAQSVFYLYCSPCVLLSQFPPIPSPPRTAGWRRVSADTAGSVRPLVPHRVLRLCVGAGGPVSAQHRVRRLPDERRHRSPDRAVRLLRPGLQTHLHASRWRSRSEKLLACAGKQTDKQIDFRVSFFRSSSAVKLLSALVDVAQSLSVSAENSQKLYEVQKAKTARQKSAAQLEKMQKKMTEVRPARYLLRSRKEKRRA